MYQAFSTTALLMAGRFLGTQRAQADPDKPHRVRLSFPPRRTADGRRISDMPVAEAARVLAELTGDSGTQSQGGQTAVDGSVGTALVR